MPKTYLFEFLTRWISDEGLRARVMHQEKTSLRDTVGLSQYQIDDLLSLDMDSIMKRLRSELESDLKINLAKVLKDIDDTGGWNGDGSGGSAGSAYEEGRPHVRGVEPRRISPGIESIVIVRGHGWDGSLEVVFLPAKGGQEVKGTLLDVDSDIDVWQRAIVKVQLPAGTWQVRARVPTSPKEKDSKENVPLVVE